MAMCGGVQNVSRPIDRCHAMSQCAPRHAEVTPMTDIQICHDTFAEVSARTAGAAIASEEATIASVLRSSRTAPPRRRRFGGQGILGPGVLGIAAHELAADLRVV